MNTRNVLAIVYFVLTIYSFSGGLVHGVANYPVMETHQGGRFSSRSQVRQQSDFRGLRSFLFLERRGQHLTDLVSPSRDLQNVGGDRGGSEPLDLGSDCDTSHTDPQEARSG
jgi:hypothetical protein